MYNALIIYIAYLVHSAPVPHLCPARQWQRQWQTDNQSEEHCAGAQMLCQILFWKWVKTCFFNCIYHVCKHALSLSQCAKLYMNMQTQWKETTLSKRKNLLQLCCTTCLKFINLSNEIFPMCIGCRHHTLLLTTLYVCVIHIPSVTWKKVSSKYLKTSTESKYKG